VRVPAAGPVVGHTITIRDRRHRFGDPEQYAAECSCGWAADPRRGSNAERLAKRDATEHIDRERSASQLRSSIASKARPFEHTPAP
jgi:hypothetical protein